MFEKPTFNNIYMLLTMQCNLKCRDCCYLCPYTTNPWSPTTEFLIEIFDKLFEIGNYHTFDLSGGEIFLRKDLHELLTYIHKYNSSVNDFWCIVTNCSVPLSEELLYAIKLYGKKMKIKLDDYGILSPHFKDIYEKLVSNDCWVEVHKYCGDDQYYGGWRDANLSPHTRRSLEDAAVQMQDCATKGRICVYEGQASHCTMDYILHTFYGVPYDEKNTIKLVNTHESVESIRKRITEMLNITAHQSCRHHEILKEGCGLRIPAAIQLSKDEIKHIHSDNLSPEEIYAITRVGKPL